METVIVTGIASGAGKTTLLSRILKNLTDITNRIGVIKCSISDNFTESSVTNAQEIISTPGTDTAVLEEAGSNRTVLIKSSRKKLENALLEAKELVGDVNYLFIEGNSAAHYLPANLIIYLNNEELEIKPSAREVIKKADIIINTDNLFKVEEIIPFKFNLDIITCSKAMLIAKLLGVKPIIIGKKFNKEKVKLTGCQLGCF